jgi:hypothetical protein
MPSCAYVWLDLHSQAPLGCGRRHDTLAQGMTSLPNNGSTDADGEKLQPDENRSVYPRRLRVLGMG